MKIAFSGKGGTGKTTLAAVLGTHFARHGSRVILIDADPDTNLQMTLGLQGKITPLIDLKSIIQERTGAEPGKPAYMFRMNPKVDDIPEKFFLKNGNLLLGVMGTIRGGGLGCACPENAFLKALLRHLILARDEVVILDMEAGVEHLGRGTTSGIDWLVIVSEPGEKSLDTTLRIGRLAGDLGIKRVGIICNKIRDEKDTSWLQEKLKGLTILGFIPYYEGIREGELKGIPAWEKAPEILEDMAAVVEKMQGQSDETPSRTSFGILK